MNDREQIFTNIIGAFQLCNKVALCGHVMPDGDCIGSMLALGQALKKMGKEVFFLSPDPIPDTYSFLPGGEEIKCQLDAQVEIDLFVSVDCSVPERLGCFKSLLYRANQVIIIDHHAGSTVFGDVYLNKFEAAAAGEIIYDIIKQMPVVMDQSIAVCLYVAIVTDTGSFRYDNTGPGTHFRVAELLKLGIPAARINKLLYEEKPLVSMAVLTEALLSLKLSKCGRIAWMSISKETLQKLGARNEHVDGIINYPRMIKGVELALFFREIDNNKFKISLRSKYFLDVNKLAFTFGGGGHTRAAGCIIEGTLPEIEDMVGKAALKALEDGIGERNLEYTEAAGHDKP